MAAHSCCTCAAAAPPKAARVAQHWAAAAQPPVAVVTLVRVAVLRLVYVAVPVAIPVVFSVHDGSVHPAAVAHVLRGMMAFMQIVSAKEKQPFSHVLTVASHGQASRQFIMAPQAPAKDPLV